MHPHNPHFTFFDTYYCQFNFSDVTSSSSSSTFSSFGPFYLSTSLVLCHLQRGTAQMFIPLVRFPLQSWVLRSFLVRLSYSFLIFSFNLNLFDCACFQYTQVLVIFLFSKRSDLPRFDGSISPLFLFYYVLLSAWPIS